MRGAGYRSVADLIMNAQDDDIDLDDELKNDVGIAARQLRRILMRAVNERVAAKGGASVEESEAKDMVLRTVSTT